MASKNNSRVGQIAEQDDIAPAGKVITQADVDAHEAAVKQAHENLGLDTDNL
jgi:hypothetical protein